MRACLGLLLRNTRKTECGAKCSLNGMLVRAAPFALLMLAAVAPADLLMAPRPSPEFAILKPAGGQLLLSHYRGKIVVVEFLLTTCPHCQEEAKLLDKLCDEGVLLARRRERLQCGQLPRGLA